MKKVQIFILLFFFKSYGQDISNINRIIGIPDVLEFQKELRIYKDYSITSETKVFRMFEDNSNNWIINIYSYNKEFNSITKINVIEFQKSHQVLKPLKPKNPDLIWLNFLLLDIEHLPNMSEIRYKLKVSKIKFEDDAFGIFKNSKIQTDGEIYNVFVKNGLIENKFNFDNAENYLKNYPNVDELILYNKFISLVKKEFKF